LEAHVNETQWINNHKEDALKTFNIELKRLTGQTIPDDQLKEAFSRLELTYNPLQQTLIKSANDAFDVGFLGKTRPDLSGIFELNILNQVLKDKGLESITSTSANQTLSTNNASVSNATEKSSTTIKK
jgi:NitT/TauT family transport system substrate-binding protein